MSDNQNLEDTTELNEEKAKELLKKALEQQQAQNRKPDPIKESEKIYKEGVELANQGCWQAAAIKFAKSIELHENGSAIENLAGILAARCLYVEAEQMYENARRLWIGLGAQKNAERIAEGMALVRAVTMDYYHSAKNTKKVKEMFENECNQDYSIFSKKAFDMTVGQKEEYKKFFFYDEVYAIKLFDDRDDYIVIGDMLSSYTFETLENKIDECMTFEDQYEEYEKLKNQFYGMLNTFAPKFIQDMRAQILMSIEPKDQFFYQTAVGY